MEQPHSISEALWAIQLCPDIIDKMNWQMILQELVADAVLEEPSEGGYAALLYDELGDEELTIEEKIYILQKLKEASRTDASYAGVAEDADSLIHFFEHERDTENSDFLENLSPKETMQLAQSAIDAKNSGDWRLPVLRMFSPDYQSMAAIEVGEFCVAMFRAEQLKGCWLTGDEQMLQTIPEMDVARRNKCFDLYIDALVRLCSGELNRSNMSLDPVSDGEVYFILEGIFRSQIEKLDPSKPFHLDNPVCKQMWERHADDVLSLANIFFQYFQRIVEPYRPEGEEDVVKPVAIGKPDLFKWIDCKKVEEVGTRTPQQIEEELAEKIKEDSTTLWEYILPLHKLGCIKNGKGSVLFKDLQKHFTEMNSYTYENFMHGKKQAEKHLLQRANERLGLS